jgi:hypothetical protein
MTTVTVASNGDVTVWKNIKKFVSPNFPMVQSDKSITFAHVVDLSDPPPILTMVFTDCKCGGTFYARKKITPEQIVQIKNCEFPKICGPDDGTILEIDERSRAFATKISGFPIIRDIQDPNPHHGCKCFLFPLVFILLGFLIKNT